MEEVESDSGDDDKEEEGLPSKSKLIKVKLSTGIGYTCNNTLILIHSGDSLVPRLPAFHSKN